MEMFARHLEIFDYRNKHVLKFYLTIQHESKFRKKTTRGNDADEFESLKNPLIQSIWWERERSIDFWTLYENGWFIFSSCFARNLIYFASNEIRIWTLRWLKSIAIVAIRSWRHYLKYKMGYATFFELATARELLITVAINKPKSLFHLIYSIN